MVKLSVCAECFFTDLPFEKRIEKIAAIGFKYVEFWHPEGSFDGKRVNFNQPKNARQLRRIAKEVGVQFSDFAFGSWDGSIGGSPTDTTQHTRWFDQIQKMLDFAVELDCPKGIVLSGMTQKNLSNEKMKENLLKALTKAADMANKADVLLLLEPLNTFVDHPGYYLNRAESAVEIIRQINSSHLKLLFDIYHMQIMQGNILSFIKNHIDIIGHFHSAGVPGRAELLDSEINYQTIIKTIDELKYEGCFGLEYFPKLEPSKSLLQTLRYLSQTE